MHSRDEDTIRALVHASPKYAKFVQQNRSVKSELYDAAAKGEDAWFAFLGFHRGGDEPAVIWADGMREWWQDGNFLKQTKQEMNYLYQLKEKVLTLSWPRVWPFGHI